VLKLPAFKSLTFFLGLLPLGYSIYQVYQLQVGGINVLGADPAKALVLLQGEWTIRFLILTLLVTPLVGLLDGANCRGSVECSACSRLPTHRSI
jgi:DMSO/TMAO reductase YedYZ heme-binding membrane subunit